MANSKKSPLSAPKKRLLSEQGTAIGSSRYQLISAAARQVRRALDESFFLEAVTLLESLIAERLEKRAQWLSQINSETAGQKPFERVADGFANLGTLIGVLRAFEKDEDMRTDVGAIDAWRVQRNGVIHEMAKFGTGDGAALTWAERQKKCQVVAVEGVRLLLALDEHERSSSHAGRGRIHASATCPDALVPLGQSYCEWCKSYESAG